MSRSVPDTLSDKTIERYARQIIVPEIGQSGQALLCAARVQVVGNDDGVKSAASYLRAAGLQVTQGPTQVVVDCAVVADIARFSAPGALPSERRELQVAWYALRGSILRSGVASLADISSVIARERATDLPDENIFSEVAHRLGGAEAAGIAIAALLGWPLPHAVAEIDLG